MDSSVVVAAPEPPKSVKLPKLRGFVISSILILAIATTAAYFLPKLIPQNKPNKVVSSTPNYSLNLNKNIQETFGSSNKYADITELNQLAYSEKNLEKKYTYYSALFAKISQTYQQTKKIEFKTILLQIKDYLHASPEYNERDFVLPK